MSTIQQTLRCSGEIVVSTDLNTSQAQKGRIVFVDKANESRVIAGMRIYGTPQSRLIIDAYNTANGLAFRTNVDQGTTTEGGKGLPYGFEILPFSVKSTLPYSVVEPSAFQKGPELGALMMNVGRYGTANIVSVSPPNTRYISTFTQNTFKTNEQIQIGVGSSNDHSVYGFQPLFASNGQPIGGTTFFGHSTSTYNEPLKCILYDQTGKVTIPGTIRATTYENLPPISAADLLPLTLNKINSRVGINNTNPQYALDVSGDIKSDGLIQATDLAITATAPGTGLEVSGDVLFTTLPKVSHPTVLSYDAATGKVDYMDAVTDLLPITLDKTNNRVGINTPAPGVELHVTGDGVFSGVLLAKGMIVEDQGLFVDGGATYLSDTTVVGRLAVVGETSTDTLSLQAIPNSLKPDVLMYDPTTKVVSYGQSPPPDLLPITLDKTNNRVGINKTVPTTALDVAGAVTASGVIVSGSVTSNTLSLTGIANSVKPDVLMYDPSTKAVSYGAAGQGSATSTNTITAVQNGSPGTAPTKANTMAIDYITVNDMGSKMCHCQFQFFYTNATGATVGNGVYLFSLPAGYAFDLTKNTPSPSTIGTDTASLPRGVYLPNGKGLGEGASRYAFDIVPYDSTRFGFWSDTGKFFSSIFGNIGATFGVTSLRYSGDFHFIKA